MRPQCLNYIGELCSPGSSIALRSLDRKYVCCNIWLSFRYSWLTLLASCESEKNDLVKENKTVTQLNNRSVKADGFYYARINFISKYGGLPQATFFATFLITLLELSIWNCPKWTIFFCILLFVSSSSFVTTNWRVKAFCSNTVKDGKTNIPSFQIVPAFGRQEGFG